jgi:hypothetical protein
MDFSKLPKSNSLSWLKADTLSPKLFTVSHQVQHGTCNYVAAMLILRQPFPVVKERHDQLENVSPNWPNPIMYYHGQIRKIHSQVLTGPRIINIYHIMNQMVSSKTLWQTLNHSTQWYNLINNKSSSKSCKNSKSFMFLHGQNTKVNSGIIIKW